MSDLGLPWAGAMAIWIVTAVLVCLINGFIAMLARGGDGGFGWGFWCGPVGIVVAAIKGAADRTEALARRQAEASDRAMRSARHVEEAAGSLAVLSTQSSDLCARLDNCASTLNRLRAENELTNRILCEVHQVQYPET